MPPSKNIVFTRLGEVRPDELLAHMADPRLREHMPLLKGEWDSAAICSFVATKEAVWHRDGFGHWAIFCDEAYVGWGGFERENGEWDFGLVLKPDAFGLGIRITKKAIAFAISDERIPYVTFLLPPSRKRLGALARLGAAFVGEIEHAGETFRKYRLDTPGTSPA